MSPSLAELTEAELLRRLARFAPPDQLSDDTAALAADARPLVINTDVLVDGIHFSCSILDAVIFMQCGTSFSLREYSVQEQED